MIKRNYFKAIASSIVSLIPIIFGMIFWNSLPDVITTHFGADGVADGFSGKAFTVFFMPLFMFALHWVCILITAYIDKKEGSQNDKVYSMLFFTCPLISLFASAIVYSGALGFGLHIGVFVSLLFGSVFIITGNYMPKTTRNRTVGIKIKWTLASDDNWAMTHRFAGRLWFFGGILLMVVAFLPGQLLTAFFITIVFILLLMPAVFSYFYYKSQVSRGEVSPHIYQYKRGDRIIGMVCAIFFATALAAVGIIMVTGNVEAYMEEEYLDVSSSYYEGAKLEYEDIRSIEFRESGVEGERELGFGSLRLSLGVFKNEELGSYTVYSYAGDKAQIVMKVGKETYVIGLRTTEETRELYERILEKMAEFAE